jgi:hypothetical protein
MRPPNAGRYMVANDDLQVVAMAKWQPKLLRWTFPNAAMAFRVTHWDHMPGPPGPPA